MTKPSRTKKSSPTRDTATVSQDSLDSLVRIMQAQKSVSPELQEKRRLLLNGLKDDMNAQPPSDSQNGSGAPERKTDPGSPGKTRPLPSGNWTPIQEDIGREMLRDFPDISDERLAHILRTM